MYRFPPLYKLGTADAVAPSPAPTGRVTAIAATSFTVTVTAVSGEASTTLRLQTRTTENGAWTTQASDATPAVGDTLTASGLTEGTLYHWRLVEEDAAGNQADGSHGMTVPATSLWATLLATISTALQGQGLASEAIYTGRQPPPHYQDVCAVLRSVRERQRGGATTQSERWEFEAEVELRVTVTDDDGGTQKDTVESWQRRLEAALHEKHAADFPGIAGLESVRVEVETKDDRGGRADEYESEVRCRAIVRFAIWRMR